MSSAVRALRGATTVDVDQPEHIQERMITLLNQLFERNDVQHEDLISIIFTATADIHSAFPAAAARVFGLGDVPLLCAQELQIHQSQPMCLRVLIHFNTERQRQELHHVYLEDAKGLRDDLLE